MRVDYHSREGTCSTSSRAHKTFPGRWQQMVPHNLSSGHSSFCIRAEKQQKKHSRPSETKPLTPPPPWFAGTWQKAVFLAEHTKRLPAFVLVPAQAESGRSGSPDWVEAGPRQEDEGVGFAYIRKTEDPARLPTFRTSHPRTEGCRVFQRHQKTHLLRRNFLFHPTHSTSQPCRNR